MANGDSGKNALGSESNASWFDNKDHVIGAIATVLFALALYILMWCASCHVHPEEPIQKWIDVGVLTFGVVCGWVVGTLVSPSVQKESDRFAKVSTAIGTFISGYVLSKIDKLTATLATPSYWSITNSFRLMMWLTGLLIAAITTYVLRAYLLPSAAGLQGSDPDPKNNPAGGGGAGANGAAPGPGGGDGSSTTTPNQLASAGAQLPAEGQQTK